MENLNEALADLRNTIAEDGFEAGMVEEFAEDYGLNPALLSRKFAEKYGKAASEYKAKSAADIREHAVARAQAEARRVADAEGVPCIGKAFEYNGVEYVGVELFSNCALMVRVSNAKLYSVAIKSPAQCYRISQLMGLV